MAGRFYPADPRELRSLVNTLLAEAEIASAGRVRALGAIVPHAGLMYSGACAARVFAGLEIPQLVVAIAPNHTGRVTAPGGASAWTAGGFETPLGRVAVHREFMSRLTERCTLISHDPAAHRAEHAIEVELPFLQVCSPESAVVPLVLAFDDWTRCRLLAEGLAQTVTEWPEPVLLLASSDMTHYEPAALAERKDLQVLERISALDGRGVLDTCRRLGVTMCGRAPAAVVLEASRRLGAQRAVVVDYRHSGWVTGEDDSVVGYAGVVIT
ncbi:MAG TPA: AmmeMemoRadiSam system protein B [Gemmatimonadales bacterium]|nr:AmmeMemoRadiSam system protein B [Gemmatimonadales bacterium]